MAIKAINPVNGKIFATYDEMTPSVVSGIISDVHEAFKRLNEGSIEHVESRQHRASKCAGRGLRVWAQHHYGARPAARLFCLRDADRSRRSRRPCSVVCQRSREDAT